MSLTTRQCLGEAHGPDTRASNGPVVEVRPAVGLDEEAVEDAAELIRLFEQKLAAGRVG